jgi:hypothetical protein
LCSSQLAKRHGLLAELRKRVGTARYAPTSLMNLLQPGGQRADQKRVSSRRSGVLLRKGAVGAAAAVTLGKEASTTVSNFRAPGLNLPKTHREVEEPEDWSDSARWQASRERDDAEFSGEEEADISEYD